MPKHFCKLPLFALFAGAFYAIASLPAYGQLAFTFTAPNESVHQGDTLTFRALLTNTTGNQLFLNNDFGLVDVPLILDDSPFQTQFLLSNPQATLLADGQPHAYDLFSVYVPIASILHVGQSTVFTGSFTLYGGATDQDQDTLGRQEFMITVSPNTSSVPEPGFLPLLATLGLSGIANLFKMKFNFFRISLCFEARQSRNLLSRNFFRNS